MGLHSRRVTVGSPCLAWVVVKVGPRALCPRGILGAPSEQSSWHGEDVKEAGEGCVHETRTPTCLTAAGGAPCSRATVSAAVLPCPQTLLLVPDMNYGKTTA